MKNTTFLLMIAFSLFGGAINDCQASDKKIGVFIGMNYFDKIKDLGYVPISDDYGVSGKYLLDNDGFSGQVGLKYKFTTRLGLQLLYLTKRKNEFDYPATSTPYVFGPNTNWSKTFVSSFMAGINIHIWEIHKVELFSGINVHYKRIELYTKTGHIHPDTHKLLYIFPTEGWGNRGTMKLFTPSISLELGFPIWKSISVNMAVEYCSGRIDEWKGGDGSHIELNDQDINGISYLLFLIYWVK